jgi:hypothetical protein
MRVFSDRILFRTLVPAALLLMLMLNTYCVHSGAQKKDLIDKQVYSDMAYGSDDYFGENTDLAYADGATPTVIVPVTPATPTPTKTTTPTVAPPPPPPVVAPPSPPPDP